MPERGQPWAKESTDALTGLVLDKEVDIEPFEQDRYDRMIGIVYRGDLNVNLDLVKRGHAWAYRKYLRKADAEFCVQEAAARTAEQGLWGAKEQPIAPWEWRRRRVLDALTNNSYDTADTCIAAIGK
jgi:endonuclease YncB( thermonuclease family)